MYLDQFAWVGLTRGRLGRDTAYTKLYAELRARREAGVLNVPLAAAHYLELFHRRDAQSRAQLAATMATVSGYVTLAAVHVVLRDEVRRVCSRILGGQANLAGPISRGELLGVGANHAFDSTTGRWRLVDVFDNETGVEGSPTSPPEEFVRFQREATPAEWEWANLVGPPDLDRQGLDARPEHRLGTEFAHAHDGIPAYVAAVGSDESFLRRLVYQHQINLMLDDIGEFMTREELDCFFTGASAGFALVESIPTAHVCAELEYWALRNTSYKFKQHDRTDVISLALALPHTDVVWFDKHWSHVAVASGLAYRYGTVSVRRLGDLAAWLDASAQSGELGA